MSEVKSIFGEFENPNAKNEEKVIKDHCHEFVSHYQSFVEILIIEDLRDKNNRRSINSKSSGTPDACSAPSFPRYYRLTGQQARSGPWAIDPSARVCRLSGLSPVDYGWDQSVLSLLGSEDRRSKITP